MFLLYSQIPSGCMVSSPPPPVMLSKCSSLVKRESIGVLGTAEPLLPQKDQVCWAL